jgi:hypothetical protein
MERLEGTLAVKGEPKYIEGGDLRWEDNDALNGLRFLLGEKPKIYHLHVKPNVLFGHQFSAASKVSTLDRGQRRVIIFVEKFFGWPKSKQILNAIGAGRNISVWLGTRRKIGGN